ncbi:tail fiber domain-containing protein, partial [Candidatus Nomurabacteria bacterium]|nr:tail fiber domain-containing protein [Candidatus Nomurabacteria bacterium]
TIVGRSAGKVLSTGSNNVIFGYQAGDNLTSGSNNIIIGHNIDAVSATGSNNMIIGNIIYGTSIDGTGTTISTGSIGIGDSSPDYRFDIDADVASYASGIFNDGNATTRSGLFIQAGVDDHTAASTSTLIGFADGDGTTVGSITFGSSATAYNTTSDRRLKENIVDTDLSIDDLMNVQVRDFTWKADSSHKLTHGFIAQELYDVYPLAVTLPNEDDGYYMVDYSKLTPLIVKAVQDLKEEVDVLKSGSFGNRVNYVVSSTISMAEAFIEKLTTKTLTVEELEVGSGDDLYCIYVKNGTLKKEQGSCDDVLYNQENNSSSGSEEVIEEITEEEPVEENIEEEVVEEEIVDIEEEVVEDNTEEEIVEEEIIEEIEPVEETPEEVVEETPEEAPEVVEETPEDTIQ